MAKGDLQDAASKAKEDVKEGASNIKAQASKTYDKAKDEFKGTNLKDDTIRNNMILFGLGGAAVGAIVSMAVFRKASMATRVSSSSIEIK